MQRCVVGDGNRKVGSDALSAGNDSLKLVKYISKIKYNKKHKKP